MSPIRDPLVRRREVDPSVDKVVLPGHRRPHEVSERLDLASEVAEGVERRRRQRQQDASRPRQHRADPSCEKPAL